MAKLDLVAVNEIKRTIKPGVKGKGPGDLGTPPKVETITPGTQFVARDEEEAAYLKSQGAAVKPKKAPEAGVTVKSDEEVAAEKAAAKKAKAAETKAAKEAEAEKAKAAKAAKETAEKDGEKTGDSTDGEEDGTENDGNSDLV